MPESPFSGTVSGMRTVLMAALLISALGGCGDSSPPPVVAKSANPTFTHNYPYKTNYDEFKDESYLGLIMKPIRPTLSDGKLGLSMFALETGFKGKVRTRESMTCGFTVCPERSDPDDLSTPDGYYESAGGSDVYWIADNSRLHWSTTDTRTCAVFEVRAEDLVTLGSASDVQYRFGEAGMRGKLTPELQAAFLDFAQRLKP